VASWESGTKYITDAQGGGMMIPNPLPNILIMSARPWRLDVKLNGSRYVRR
jgi:hypothetical protein